MKYNPNFSPNPDEWLMLDEETKQELVLISHIGVDLPNSDIHATTHVIVENQLAMKELYFVNLTLVRLISQGIDRHSAVHAIGSIVMQDLFLRSKSGEPFSEENYKNMLNRLKAKDWV